MLRISNLKIRENLSNDELLKTIIKKSIDARKKMMFILFIL